MSNLFFLFTKNVEFYRNGELNKNYLCQLLQNIRQIYLFSISIIMLCYLFMKEFMLFEQRLKEVI